MPIATVAKEERWRTTYWIATRFEDVLARAATRGFSLVEVIVTITLMAVVLVPIMSAVAASIKSSSRGRSAAQVETALVNAADRVNRAGMGCDYTNYVQAAVMVAGLGLATWRRCRPRTTCPIPTRRATTVSWIPQPMRNRYVEFQEMVWCNGWSFR